MSDFDQEMQLCFLEEAKDLLANSEQCFLNLERAKDDPTIIEQIFRLAHNLKGSAGAVGFHDLAEFAHLLESFLLKVKERVIQVDSGIVSLLLLCNDHLCAFIEGLRSDFKFSKKDPELIEKIKSYLSGKQETQENQLAEQLAELTTSALQQSPVRAPVSKASAPSDESIRVNLSRIDRLMNNVGELVILQTVMSQQKDILESPLQQHTVAQMEKIIREVQEISMSLRMLPLKQTFQKMQRIVRDSSQALGKDVELEVIGEDTELDKNVLEQIGDPLVHLVRNAVDHGIESTEERTALQKSRKGRITLIAKHRGSHIVIEVRDDGKGLDAKKLVTKAIEKGILSDSASLSEEEAYRLIFAPGFSTKAEVTDISGRGVGMDVVRTNIEQLQGTVELETELGKSTCVRILLPLTLAIVDGMVIRVGEERYVVPIAQIQQSLQPRQQDISFVTEVGEILNLRGDSLPLYRLDRLLGSQKSRKGDPAWQGIALVSSAQSQRAFAFLADDILGQQQVVIKRLGEEIHGLPGITGAAILGDGKAALILDLHELIHTQIAARTKTAIKNTSSYKQKEAA
jgi:two-component system chemotaxis sensor kinase CheA